MLYKFMKFSVLDCHIQSIFSQGINVFYIVSQNRHLQSTILSCSDAVNKVFQIHNHKYTCKILSVADILNRSFTKAELQIDQLKQEQPPPKFDFASLQNNTLKPVHYLVKHEEILSHQKHDSHPILAD